MHDGTGGAQRRIFSFSAGSQSPRFVSADVDDASGVVLALAPGDDVRSVALEGVTLVTLSFPKASEGRAYTQARVLREDRGYRGHIRAVGAVVVDALGFMRRAGIDEAVLRDASDEAFAVDVVSHFTVKYQASADEPNPLWRRVKRGDASDAAVQSRAVVVHRGQR